MSVRSGWSEEGDDDVGDELVILTPIDCQIERGELIKTVMWNAS